MSLLLEALQRSQNKSLALDTTVGRKKMTSSLLLLAFFLYLNNSPRPGTLPMPGV